MSAERPTRAELRAGRQSERRSGRGFPKQLYQSEVVKSAVKERAGRRPYLTELGKRVPVLASVILSSVVAACDARGVERDLSAAEPPVDKFPSAVFSPGEPIPSPVPTPDDLGKFISVLHQDQESIAVIRSQEEVRPTTTPTAGEINREPGVVMGQVTPISSEIQSNIYQEKQIPALVLILGTPLRLVSEEEMERALLNKNSELSLSQHSPTFFEHSSDRVREIDPELDAELKERTRNLLHQINGGMIDLDPKTDEYRDFIIYAYHNGLIGRDAYVRYILTPDSRQLYLTLAGHELEYIRNPLIQRAASELEASGAMKAINMILKENVSSSFFNEGKLPQLPETRQEILASVVFAGGDSLGGGHGYQYHPLLIGGYDQQDISYEVMKKNFINFFTHEAVHSFLQFDGGELYEIDWSSPRGRFIHALHGIPEVMAEWMSGAGKSEPNPLIVFVYGVLKEGGVENPLSEMLSSMATASYLVSYDEVRGNHPSIDEIFAQDDWKNLPPGITEEIMETYYQYRDDFMEACLGDQFGPTETEAFIGNLCGVQSISENDYFARFSVPTYSYLQEKYDEYGGRTRLGDPISKQIGEYYEPKGVLQFFNHAVLAFGHREENYPGMDLTVDHIGEGSQSGFKEYMLIPIGWYLYNDYLQRETPTSGEPGWVNQGDFQIDSRILDFYEENGGVSFLGIPVSNSIELSPGKFVQWTTFARIEFMENGQAQLAPLGEEYYRPQIEANPEFCDYALFPCLAYTPEKVAKLDSVLDKDIQRRTLELMVWLSKNMGQDFWSCSSYEKRTESYRDWLIYAYHNGILNNNWIPEFVLVPSQERIYSTLAMHEFLMRDSFFPQVAVELERPIETMNRMLKDDLDPKLFYDGIVPQIPATDEEILNSVVLGRGDISVRRGLGYGDFSVLFGRYWMPGYSYEEVEQVFSDFFVHEKGHSNLQTYRATHLEGLDWNSPEGFYVHELHYILVDMVGRMMGYREADHPPRLGFDDPGLPPRIGYLYGHLVEGGYEPQEAFKILLNSLASGSCLYPNREIINRIYSDNNAYYLPPETKREIEEMNDKYWKELVDLYMRYSK